MNQAGTEKDHGYGTKWHQDGSDDRCKGCGNSEGESDQIVCDGKTKADF
ncbi:MAG: hypothetical protein RL293_1753 [Bacteroidota bacterium]